MMNEQQFNSQLKQFTGSEVLYKYILGLKITEGVKFACETVKCWWFADIVASYQLYERIRGEEFQTWTLTVENRKGVVIATDGNKKELLRQHIPYTHFPYSGLTYWCIDGIILLPNEY
jgi:hypothetical protein